MNSSDKVYFETPLKIFCSGNSNSGKTYLIAQICREYKEIVRSPEKITKFVLVFQKYQDVYDSIFATLPPSCEIILMNEFNNKTLGDVNFWNNNEKGTQFLLIDDHDQSISNSKENIKTLENLTTFMCRHYNINLLYINHSITKNNGKTFSEIARNCNYIIILKSNFQNTIFSLERNLFPYKRGILTKSISVAEQLGYKYLIIDLSSNIENRLKLRSGLPNEIGVAYHYDN